MPATNLLVGSSKESKLRAPSKALEKRPKYDVSPTPNVTHVPSLVLPVGPFTGSI